MKLLSMGYRAFMPKVIWLIFPAIIFWLARKIPIDEVLTLSSALSLTGLVWLVGLNAVAAVTFSSRWWLALRSLGYRVSNLALVQYRLAAFSISYFTPGTQFGGEPLQVHALEKRHQIPRAGALASVSIDKLFELLANFSFLAIGLALLLQSNLLSGSTPILAGVWSVCLLALPAAYLIAASRGRQPLSACLAHFPAPLRHKTRVVHFKELAENTEKQIVTLLRERPITVAFMLAASIWTWILMLLEYWLALSMLGVTLTFQQTIVAMAAARVAFLIPVPAGLGALEAGQVFTMQALGFDPAVGLAISIWIRLRDLFFGGLGFLFGAVLFQSRPAASLAPEAGD